MLGVVSGHSPQAIFYLLASHKIYLDGLLTSSFFLHSLLLNYNDPSLRQSIYRLQRTRPDATGCSPPARPLPDFPEALAGFELVHRPSPDVPASFVS